MDAVAFLLLVLVCIWAVRRFGWDALFFVCLNYPVGLGIVNCQDSAWMLVLLIIGFTLAEKGRDFWSGAVLGLGLIKFHLWLVYLPAMLVCRRSKMALGYLATAFLMAAACLILGGPRVLLHTADCSCGTISECFHLAVEQC